jgi:hypothetical protein
MIKKCSGFDMNILCFDPAYQNHEFVKSMPGAPSEGRWRRPRRSAPPRGPSTNR